MVKKWDKRFGGTDSDVFNRFQQTKDGGYILGGYSGSGISGDKTQNAWGNYDYWIVKIDSVGNKMWDKRFGGTGGDFLTSLQQTADGGFMLGGSSVSGISGDKTQANWDTTGLTQDYWVVKTDSMGNKQWDKDFGGTNIDNLYSLQQTADGGYILGGYSRSGISGDKTQACWDTSSYYYYQGDYWIVKTDSLGNKQWDKNFGGFNVDKLTSLQQTSDGGYILGGFSYSDISGDKTQPSWYIYYYDYWIVKTDSSGNKQWDKDFGGTTDDELFSLQQTADGGYILGGYSNSGISGDKTQNTWGNYDYWIVKTDSLGNIQWDKDFGGSKKDHDIGNISITADGGYLVAGTSYSNSNGNKTENNLGPEQMWIVKTDSLGIIQWDKTILTHGHEELSLAVQTKDGCFAVANYTKAPIGGYKTQPNWDTTNVTVDYWMIKFCDSTLTTNLTPALSEGEGVAIAPNPVNEEFKVQSSKFKVERIEIFNLLGETMICVSPSPSGRVRVGLLPNGLYIIKAHTEKSIFQQKLVIHHMQ